MTSLIVAKCERNSSKIKWIKGVTQSSVNRWTNLIILSTEQGNIRIKVDEVMKNVYKDKA
jgi:hypothetical protein